MMATAVAHSAGWYCRWTINLGFRYAPPQALRYRLLRRLGWIQSLRELCSKLFHCGQAAP